MAHEGTKTTGGRNIVPPEEERKMRRLALLSVICALLAIVASTAYAAFGTYSASSGVLPAPPDWIQITDTSGETWLGNDGGTPILRIGMAQNSSHYNSFQTTVGTATEVSAGMRFRLKYVNNMVNAGPAMLALFTRGGAGISLAVSDKDYPSSPDRYWYILDQWDEESNVRILKPIQMLPEKVPTELNGAGEPITVQEDPFYHTVWLYTNSVNHRVMASWDGQVIYDAVLDDPEWWITSYDGTVDFGAATLIQHLGGRVDNRVFVDWVTVQPGMASVFVPEPGTFVALGVGLLGLIGAVRRKK